MNNNKPMLLSESALTQISGGISSSTIWGGILVILEAPHIFMGVREFTNYTVELYKDGCVYDESDHFTKFFCTLL